MASNRLIILVILSVISTSLQDTNDNEIEEEDVNPFAETAASILKEQNAQNIGAMVNNFMQSGGAAQLGDMLSKMGGENAGQLLQGLASLVGSDQKEEMIEKKEEKIEKKKSESSTTGDSTGKLLKNLGTLMGVLQGAGGGDGGGDGTAALLQGLGSLIGGQGGQGIDPSLIGTVLNLFNQNEAEPSKPKSGGKKKPKINVKFQNKDTGNTYDVSSLLSLAAGFLTQGQGQDQGQGNLLNYLPMILQTIGSFTGPEAEKRAEDHADHSSRMPPFLEKIHIAFDNFIHSEMGKYFINVIGAEKAFKVFEDENGRFSYAKFTEMMENLSFRRHWIRMVTDRLVDMLQYASDPKTQKAYLANAQFLVNSFLKTQGFPKTAFFDPSRPTETLSALVDHVIKKYFEVKVQSKEYVKPIVEYVKSLNRLAQKKGELGGVSRELSDMLADTINLEIIEPIARVNRAYRFAKSTPACDRYVLCIVNEKNPNEVESLPGLKKLLYKGSSLAAAWFLSDESGTSFWTLYGDVTENDDCKALYSEKCHDFHLEEIRVTTEYVHNEL